MAERFTRVFSQQGEWYTCGAPVVVEAGALLKDNQTGKIIAQMKFKNISAKVLCALTVKILTKDVYDVDIEGVAHFQYLDLKVRQDGEFGTKTPIVLPDNTARSYTCECISAVFEDGTVWNWDNKTPWQPIPAGITLGTMLDGGQVEQYRVETTEQALYIPAEQGEIWRCACGVINSQGTKVCRGCHCDKRKIFDALDPKKLTENKIQYDEKNRKYRAFKMAGHVVQQHKILFIGIAAVLVIALICGLGFLNLESRYAEAAEQYASGQYIEAVDSFKALGDYKDSQIMVDECYYQYAIELYNKGNLKDLETARAILEGLGDYRLSQSYLREIAELIVDEF